MDDNYGARRAVLVVVKTYLSAYIRASVFGDRKSGGRRMSHSCRICRSSFDDVLLLAVDLMKSPASSHVVPP